jgi:C4-dicarboxylate transporter, DctQ subunit
MLLRAVYVLEDVLSRLLIALIALIVFVQVISRYVFSKAITWSEELSTIAMVWAVYLGAAMAMRKRFHIRILVLVRLMPRTMALATVIIGDILFLLFCGLMLWFSYEYLSLLWTRASFSPALGVNQFYPHSIVFIAYALIVLHSLAGYVDWWRSGCEGLPGIDEVEGTTAALVNESG